MEDNSQAANLLDVIENKLQNTGRKVFTSRIVLCAKVVDRQVTQDQDIASMLSLVFSTKFLTLA